MKIFHFDSASKHSLGLVVLEMVPIRILLMAEKTFLKQHFILTVKRKFSNCFQEVTPFLISGAIYRH